MLAALSGLTAACGSTSALRYSVPPSAPPVQLGAKGVSLETRTGVSPINGGSMTVGGGGGGGGAGGGDGAAPSEPPPQPISATATSAVENSQRPAVIDISHNLV